MNLSEAAIKASISKMPVLNHPKMLGEMKSAFDFVSRQTLDAKRARKVSPDEFSGLDIGIEQVERTMPLEYVHAKKHLRMVAMGTAALLRTLARRMRLYMLSLSPYAEHNTSARSPVVSGLILAYHKGMFIYNA